MKRSLPILLLIVLFGSFGLVAWHLLRARVEAGRDLPAYSVYSEMPDGLAETARFVRKLGWEPVALTRPIRQLRPGTAPRLLVMVEPHAPGTGLGGQADFAPAEVRGLLGWVKEGNTLLLLSRQRTALHTELGITLRPDPTATEADLDREVVPHAAGGYTAGIERLRIEGQDQLQGGPGLPLWTVPERPGDGARLVRHGRGRVLVVADASLLTRRGLVRADNALFLYNVLRLHAHDGQVFFDEYHHGLHAGGGFWGYLPYHRLHWALLPVLATLLVAGWSVGVRLGPAVPHPQPSHTDAVDYASALARIYQGAGAQHLLAGVLTRDFANRLAALLKLRRSTAPADLRAAWRQHQGSASTTLDGLLDAADELRHGRPTNALLLRDAQAFARFLQDHGTV